MMMTNKYNLNILLDLYKINSYSRYEHNISKYIIDYLSKFNVKIKKDSIGNIYITKGESKNYPCVVAHLDQVQNYDFTINPIIYHNKYILGFDSFYNQVGLGADDKNGIWIILNLLESEPILKAVLFVQEEIGCLGSYKCDLSFFEDTKYIIQCDRKGNSDFIFSTYSIELCNKTFIPRNLLNKYKYKPNTGIMTDVESLKFLGYDKACCNLSCGYYNAHSNKEFTIIQDLFNCLNLVKEIIKTVPLTKHTSKFNDYGGYFNFYYEMDKSIKL